MSQQQHFSYFTRLFALLFLVASFAAAPALAQDGDQEEYKRVFNSALEAGKNNDYETAYENFKRAAQLAEQAGDENVAQKARETAAKLDYNFGLQHLRNEQYDQAIARFDASLELIPQLGQAYWAKGQAYTRSERPEEAIATYEEAMSVGEEQGNTGMVDKAKSKIRDHYAYLASQTLSDDNISTAEANEALEHLSNLDRYEIEPDASIYFYRATAQNALGNHQEAVNLSDQALEVSRGSRTDNARIYFLKGEALMQLGDENGARAAFENATFGDYQQPAEHYLEQLNS